MRFFVFSFTIFRGNYSGSPQTIMFNSILQPFSAIGQAAIASAKNGLSFQPLTQVNVWDFKTKHSISRETITSLKVYPGYPFIRPPEDKLSLTLSQKFL